MSREVMPEIRKTSFNCPHCGVLAPQGWSRVLVEPDSTSKGIDSDPTVGPVRIFDKMLVSECSVCGNRCVWRGGQMIFPQSSTAPLPHEDMPSDIREDYEEA